MRYIPLSKYGSGSTAARAIVDDIDYPFLSHWTWKLHNGEAVRKGDVGYVFMHFVVAARAGIPGAEHISANHLDNRRSNLPAPKTSGIPGVDWYEREKMWGRPVATGRGGMRVVFFANLNDARNSFHAPKPSDIAWTP
jgi:hypothetical protein